MSGVTITILSSDIDSMFSSPFIPPSSTSDVFFTDDMFTDGIIDMSSTLVVVITTSESPTTTDTTSSITEPITTPSSIVVPVSSDITDIVSSTAVILPSTTSIELSTVSSQFVSLPVSTIPSFTSSMVVVSSVSSSVSPSPSPTPFLSVGLDGLNNTFLAYPSSSFDLITRFNIIIILIISSNFYL